jgi:aryl-alcohol dehydrogenase-like predicted oxidoreductase
MNESKLEMVTLGRTGLKINRFGVGGHFTYGPSSHEDIPRRVRELHHLLDLGVNYFDVQWDPEEIATAEVMQTRKDEFTVAWPLHGVTRLGGNLTEKYILDYAKNHRSRYNIQHVDILLWVALELYEETEEHVMNVLRSAFSTLKSEGFCDYLAFSCHHSPEMALRAITKFDDFDVMMVPYSALHPAAGRELLKTAKAKGVGTVGMKLFGGGGGFFNSVWSGQEKHPETDRWYRSERPYEAAVRWALKNRDLDCVVPGVHSIEQINQIFQAAQEEYSDEDEAILNTMKKAMIETQAEYQLKKIAGRPDSWD